MDATYVRDLQDDFRFLMRHVARRRDRALPWTTAAAGPTPPRAAEGGTAPAAAATADRRQPLEELPVELLVERPTDILRSVPKLAALHGAVDRLTAVAAPANVTTIRLTCAFVKTEEYGTPAAPVTAEAKRLKAWMLAVTLFGSIVFLLTILLLIHVDAGRRTIQELQGLREQQQSLWRDIETAMQPAAAVAVQVQPAPGGAAPAQTAVATAPAAVRLDCRLPPPAGATGTSLAPEPGARLPANGREESLCARYRDLDKKTDLVYHLLRTWNGTTDNFAYLSPFPLIWANYAFTADLPKATWQSTEIRTGLSLAALTGFVLPLLLGFLGACAFVYRHFDAKIRDWTLEARDGWHALLRVLLGGILGGLLGVIWTNGEPVQLQGFALSLAAVAFFVGFAVEVVFRTLDTMVQAVADKLRTR